MRNIYVIYRHAIGTPDYIDVDLSLYDDCFLFFSAAEAEKCAEDLTRSSASGEGADGYRYYAVKL